MCSGAHDRGVKGCEVRSARVRGGLDGHQAGCRADEAFDRGERVVSWVAMTLDGLRGLAGR